MKDPTIRRVYSQLRNEITFGKFKPGDHLSEKLLTQKYNVSRASVREVIGQLASQGYLTVEPNRGAAVTRLSLEDIDVTYRILTRCESLAAYLTAKEAKMPLIKKLRNSHEKMIQQTLDPASWLQRNDVFHETIYTNCQSTILINLIHHTRLRIYRYRMVKTDPEIIRAYNDQHERILSAIADRDRNLADELMREHLELARKNRFEVFKEFRDLM